jgi:hypothetical protein
MKQKLITLVESVDEKVLSCHSYSFKNDSGGIGKAFRTFKRLHKEHNDPDGTTEYVRPSNKEFLSMFNEGLYDDDCGYRITVVHGTLTI